MTKVVLKDAALVAALDAIADRSQLCDDTGRILGYFVPQSSDRPISYRGVKSPLRRMNENESSERNLAKAKLWPSSGKTCGVSILKSFNELFRGVEAGRTRSP